MKYGVSIEFNDLSDDKQDDLVQSVKEWLMEQYEVDGEKALAQEWHDPQPTSWQEAFVRSMSINHIMWDDYERRDADAEVPKQADWDYWLSKYAEDQARDKLYDAFKYSEAEVEL